MPMWLQTGISNLLSQANLDHGKLEFRTDDWMRDDVREAVRNGKALTPRQIMTMDGESMWKDYVNFQQGQALVAFLATGSASKTKQAKDFLPAYLQSLKGVLGEVKAEEEKNGKAGANKAPTTEAEEDAQLKSRHEGYTKNQKRILDQTLERAAAGWGSEGWTKFEELYFKSLGKKN